MATSAPQQQQQQQEPRQPTKEEADMTQSLAQDRPTIDAAIKSYISLVCAKALTASATDDVVMGEAAAEESSATTSTIPLDQASKTTLLGFIPSSSLAGNSTSTSTSTTNNATTDATVTNNNNSKTGGSVQQNVLQLARIMLQTLNQYTFPIHCTVANETAKKPGLSQNQQYFLLELSIASQLWNGLVQSKQKPSRFFGRKALKHAWKHQLGDEILTKLKSTTTTSSPDVLQQQQQQQLQWLSEFEKLLFSEQQVTTIEVSTGIATDLDQQKDDDDSALLWAADGGTAELAKRRTRRQQAATKRETTNTTAAPMDTTTTTTTTSSSSTMNTIAE